MKSENEYAKQLINQFSYNCRECDNIENAKFFAIFCVDEIISALKKVNITVNDWAYYERVKQIIRNEL